MKDNISKSILNGLKEAEGIKKTYYVYIEETICDMFEVEATSMEEASDIAEEKYKNGEFVLEPGELEGTQLKVSDPETGEETSWVEVY